MAPDDDVYAEETLLIDPCFDDPEDYLGYDPTGQVFPLDDNPYGGETIDVFHLQRRRLRVLRRQTIVGVAAVMKIFAKAMTEGNENLAMDLKSYLASLGAADSQYAGLVRYVAKRAAEFGV